MKHLILVFLLISTSAHAAGMNKACRGDSMRPEGDKMAHLEWSVAIGAGARAVIDDPMVAFGASLLPGLYREGWRGNCFSFQDMAYNIVGSAIGVYSANWVIGPQKVVFRMQF